MERIEIGAALSKVRVPVFLAQSAGAGRGDRIVLHTTDGESVPLLRKQAQAALGVAATFKIVAHKPASLTRKKSLEALNETFGVGDILFDPTGAIGRAASITACAASIRKALDGRVRGVLLDAERRALFVILDRRRFSDIPATLLDERVEAMRLVAETFSAWCATTSNGSDLAVRIGFELPMGVVLVPVDRRSEHLAKDRRFFFERLRKPGIAATLASFVGLGSAAQAVAADVTMPGVYTPAPSQNEPAVAAPNIGFIGAGGWLTGDGVSGQGYGVGGLKATIPLGDKFGAQLDLAVGTNSYYGVGGHLFWRNPSQGMLGVVGSYESMSSGTLSRFAVEGEIYKGDFTLRGSVGAQTGTTDGAFGSADIVFYATPNFSATFGGEVGNRSLARAVLEWQPAFDSLPGLSLFASGEVGTNSYAKVMAGVKYYFGTNGASLKDRDRRYDPTFSLNNTQNLLKAGYTPPPT